MKPNSPPPISDLLDDLPCLIQKGTSYFEVGNYLRAIYKWEQALYIFQELGEVNAMSRWVEASIGEARGLMKGKTAVGREV